MEVSPQKIKMEACCAYFDPDYENLNARMYGARVAVDNESCETCTVVKVNSITEQDLLLVVLQVLTDMDLCITKCYVSCDAGWFMDVFHVKDQDGNKVEDDSVCYFIQEAIGEERLEQEPTPRKLKETMTSSSASSSSSLKTEQELPDDCTEIEITGPNRPGIFSEISAVLAEQRCNIVEAHAWTHNDCLACVAKISSKESDSDLQITDPNRLSTIEDHLSNVLPTGDVKARFLGGSTSPSSHAESERRLHQLMFARRDFDFDPQCVKPREKPKVIASYSDEEEEKEKRKTVISIEGCNEMKYSVVSVECLDRPRLMFDTVCTLVDLNYVVFHASIISHGPFVSQEFYIRHKNGRILDSLDERQLVIKCLEAAIERRVSEGVRLELCTENKAGSLSHITRVLRENGLTVAHADIESKGENSTHVLYVQEISGNTEIDMNVIESVKKQLNPLKFDINNYETGPVSSPRKIKGGSNGNSPVRGDKFSFVDMIRSGIGKISNGFVSM